MGLKSEAIRMVRRAAKGAAATAFHYSGAADLLASVQRRAVGGRRVLILSYHRVVGNFAVEAARSLPTLNISQETFSRHLETLAEDYDIVTLDRALEVLEDKAPARRDVAVITFDTRLASVITCNFLAASAACVACSRACSSRLRA